VEFFGAFAVVVVASGHGCPFARRRDRRSDLLPRPDDAESVRRADVELLVDRALALARI
jgi:hypothetical protein